MAVSVPEVTKILLLKESESSQMPTSGTGWGQEETLVTKTERPRQMGPQTQLQVGMETLRPIW